MSYSSQIKARLAALRHDRIDFLRQVKRHHEDYRKVLGLTEDEIKELESFRGSEPICTVPIGKLEFILTLLFVHTNTAPNGPMQVRITAACSTCSRGDINIISPNPHDVGSYIPNPWHDILLRALAFGSPPSKDINTVLREHHTSRV